jgi:hypothetical protein
VLFSNRELNSCVQLEPNREGIKIELNPTDCQRRSDSRPAWRCKSRPLMARRGCLQKGPPTGGLFLKWLRRWGVNRRSIGTPYRRATSASGPIEFQPKSGNLSTTRATGLRTKPTHPMRSLCGSVTGWCRYTPFPMATALRHPGLSALGNSSAWLLREPRHAASWQSQLRTGILRRVVSVHIVDFLGSLQYLRISDLGWRQANPLKTT